MVTKTSLRYAHSEGFVSIFWLSSTKKFFTCGSDGEIRIWQDFETDDPVSHTVSEQATAVCAYEEKLFVADEAGYIRTFLLPDYIKDGFVTKFNECVTHMTVNKTGARLLACSRDFSIKWVAVTDSAQVSFGSSEGHNAPVLSVALDPKEEFFASSSCDGSVKIWKVDEHLKPTKNLQILEKFNDISCSRPICRMQWHPQSGEILAVPVNTGVHLYGRNAWNLIKTLHNEAITDSYSVCSFSPCGKYLAAACTNGQIIVWDYVEETVLLNEQHVKKQPICELLWHPSYSDRLIYCDTNGHVGVIKNFLSQNDKNDLLVSATSEFKQQNDELDDNFADEDDDADIGAIKSKYNSQIFLDDDEDTAAAHQDHTHAAVTCDKTKRDHVPIIPSWKPKPAQTSFVAGSTPPHLTERFLKWNSVGIVRQYNTEEECCIDVEFHDASVYHSLQIDNSVAEYAMADLSTEALALATNGTEENNFKSRLYVLHFGSWDSSRDWSADLPDGENIIGLCLGSGWVALAAKSNTVWVFTVAGVQLRNFDAPDTIVTIAGTLNTLLVAFHNGLDVEGTTKLCCSFYGNVLCYDSSNTWKSDYLPIALCKNSELAWLGFTAEGTPCTCDSLGIVRLLYNFSWFQIFDWKHEIGEDKLDTDFLWLTSVHESSSQIRGVRCKRSKFPPILPRPVVNVFPFRYRSCDPATEKTIQEERFFGAKFKRRLSGLDDEEKSNFEKAELESILKLFLLACNADRECRALEVASLADSTTTLNALINLATKKRRTVLAEKVADLARCRVAEREELNRREENVAFTCGTQQLFPDDDGAPSVGQNGHNLRESELHSPSVVANEENPLRRQESRNSASFLNINAVISNGTPKNPFKRNSVDSFDNNGSAKIIENRKGVFDNIETNAVKRHHDSADLLDIESKSTKKKKTLVVKKQSKLSFGNGNAAPIANSNISKNGQGMNGFELFKKENTESISQQFLSVTHDSPITFDEFAEQSFKSLAEEDRENWNGRALSLLDELDKVQSKRKVSLDSFVFSE